MKVRLRGTAKSIGGVYEGATLNTTIWARILNF